MAARKDEGSLRSAATIFTPLEARDWDFALEGSRVIPRRAYLAEREGRERTVLMMLPPWLPVAPKMVKSFLEDMVEGASGSEQSFYDVDAVEVRSRNQWLD